MDSGSYKEREKLNHLKLKSIIENVKSQYILRKIFNNLSKKKSLYLIKYNNNIKNRINKIIMIIKNILKYIHRLN